MKFNEEVGRRIKLARNDAQLSLKELGNLVGLSDATVQRYEAGKIKGVDINLLQRIADALHVSPAYLMGWEEPDSSVVRFGASPSADGKLIPLLGTIAAGVPILAEENIEGYYVVDKSLRAAFALRVCGDSMIDENIFDGDIAFLNEQPDVENGEIAAVVIDDSATLKKVYHTDRGIVLQAANSKYNPIVITDEALENTRIVGRLVAVLNER